MRIMRIQILTNISRSKGKQRIKFGHLAEYGMRHFPEKHTENEVEKLVPDHL